MSLSQKFQSALLSCGVSLPGEIDISIVDYLLEAVNCDDFTKKEKIELLCDTIPSLSELSPQSIESVLARCVTVSKSSTAGQKNNRGEGAVKAVKAKRGQQTEPSCGSQRISDDIKSLLESKNIDSVDIVEIELVDYIMTSLEGIENPMSQSGTEIDEFRDLVESFFSDVGRDTDTFNRLVDILVSASSERKVLERKKLLKLQNSEAAPQVDSSSSCTVVDVSHTAEIDSHDSLQMHDDIVFLKSLMPHILETLIRYVYTVLCGSNRVESGQYLVEHSDDEGLRKLKESKSLYDKRELESATLTATQMKKMRDRLCDRYGEKVVPDKYDSKGKEVRAKKMLPIQFVDISGKEKKVSICNFLDWLKLCLLLSATQLQPITSTHTQLNFFTDKIFGRPYRELQG